LLGALNKSRLEAFSDGVIAILITIMVLELRIPEGSDWNALRPIVPVFITYVLSFVFLGIYWNNHHHLIHAADRITGAILWANLHLLFWLSLTPFATGWMGRNNFAPLPTAVYGGVLLCAAMAYTILVRTIIAAQGRFTNASGMAAAFMANDAYPFASLPMASFSLDCVTSVMCHWSRNAHFIIQKARHLPLTALCPRSKRAADRDDLAEVIGVVIGDEEKRAEAGLVALARRDQRVEIRGLARQLLELLAFAREGRNRLVPRGRVRRRGMLGPVVVRPFHLVDVLRVHAEVEDVLLRDAHVLEQLPHGMLEPGRAGTALIRRQAVDRLVEAHVRFCPVEKPDQLFTKRFVAHEATL